MAGLSSFSPERLRGDQALREGRPVEAIGLYQSVAAAGLDDAALWFNLAWAQRQTRRFDDALTSYARAIELGLDRPEEAHLNRAALLAEQLDDSEGAIAALQSAIAINPQFVEGWLNLGNVHEDLGQSAEARRAYEAALRIAPDNGRAQARLGAIDLFEGRSDRAIAHLRSAIDRATSMPDRSEMLFALGDALDASGDYADAFQAYEAANFIAHALARSRYDPAAQTRLTDRLIAAFPGPPRSAATADAGGEHLFICGMFRSGSTLAERLLSRHPSIWGAGELDLIPAIAAAMPDYPAPLSTPGSVEADTLIAGYPRPPHGAAFMIDKRCDNVWHIGLIKTLFPRARIIHTTRNPLDNLLSVYALHFGEAVTYGNHLGEAVHYYREYRRIMAHWKTVFPGDIHDLDYDALVRDPREALGAALDWIGVDWDDACLQNMPQAGGAQAVRTASAWQVRRPLHDRSSGRWQHYRAQLEPVRQALAAAGFAVPSS